MQINAENHTPSRFEAETDVDWTVVANLSSVLGSSRVNTFRVSATKEDVFFGNPRFNAGEDQKILPSTLDQLSFSDQQSPRANRRLDIAYGADNIFAWFVPNKWGGDHDMKFGVSYLYSSLRTQDDGNLNGTFTVPSDLTFNAANPRTYPERLAIRVAESARLLHEGPLHRDVRAGQVAAHRPPDGERRPALRPGDLPDAERATTRCSTGDLGDYPIDANNFAPRAGLHLRDGRLGPVGAPRRLRTLLPAHGVHVPDARCSRQAAYSDSFTVMFPVNNADPGPRAGTFPTNPALVNGPVVDHAAIDAQFPPGTLQSERAARCGSTTRIDRTPGRASTASDTSSSSGPRWASRWTSSAPSSVEQYVLMDLNPGIRDTTLATSTLRRTTRSSATDGEFAASVDTPVNVG